MNVNVQIEAWPLAEPFRITGHVFTALDVIVVELEADGYCGRGEGCGAFYKGETAAVMKAEVEQFRSAISAIDGRADLLTLMPASGARNAVDCAMWDLEAKRTGVPAWERAGLSSPRPLLTTYTLGADSPAAMARKAEGYKSARALKLKLTGDGADAERIAAVRAARPDIWLGVDANQGFSRATLEALMPALVQARVELIEQPLPMDQDAGLDGLYLPIALAADESIQDMDDFASVTGRFDVVNIKLDKCGGLTRGLEMAHEAKRRGLQVMVGNMGGTSLSMAPAFLLGQLCEVVDLDGPILLREDRVPAADYSDGRIDCASASWGRR